MRTVVLLHKIYLKAIKSNRDETIKETVKKQKQ